MVIKNCWDEDPEKRPDFKKIELTLGKIFRYVNTTHSFRPTFNYFTGTLTLWPNIYLVYTPKKSVDTGN